MKILLAPDKFKGSITAREVTSIWAEEIELQVPGCQIIQVPLADGGDGSLDVVCDFGMKRVGIEAPNALGVLEPTSYGISEDVSRAFIELAEVCGIAELGSEQRDPWNTSTKGIGIVIKDAIAKGARSITLSIGGSASIDGGAGMLVGLGARLLDDLGNELSGTLTDLSSIKSIDLAEVDQLLKGIDINLLSDVDNPLIGEVGAAAVYGKQKGLKDSDVVKVDAALISWAKLLTNGAIDKFLTAPQLGAAGGVALPLVSQYSAQIKSGTEFFFDFLNIEELIAKTDLVITGEGSFDQQSFMGKIVGRLVDRALAHSKPTFVIAGMVGDIKRSGFKTISLTQLAGDSERSRENPKTYLRQAINLVISDQSA